MAMKIVRMKKKFVFLIVFCVLCLFLLIVIDWNSCLDSTCYAKNGAYVHKYANRVWRNATVKRILRWTGFFGDPSWEESDDRLLRGCKVNTCTITNNRALLEESDAVLFHVGALWNFWRGVSMPSHKPAFQVWILNNVEPPPRTPLNLRSLNGVFNWTAWYRLDSDVPVGYGGVIEFHPNQQLKYQNSSFNFALKNTRLAAWMSSNCYDYNRRQKLVREIRQNLPLDMYGKCGGRRCPETICRDTISNYKFFLTFENCNCKDYITEKFWEALRRQQVPIVYGGGNYKKVAPPNSFIDVNDFPDVPSLTKYLLKLDKDDNAYNKYLEWTKKYDVYGEIQARRNMWCDLCEALHDTERPAQVYTNLEGWVRDDRHDCPQWTLKNQVSRYVDGLRFKLGIL